MEPAAAELETSKRELAAAASALLWELAEADRLMAAGNPEERPEHQRVKPTLDALLEVEARLGACLGVEGTPTRIGVEKDPMVYWAKALAQGLARREGRGHINLARRQLQIQVDAAA